jgi:hypothetical protein
VLRLWRDQVRIALCPDRVITTRYKAGLRPNIVAKNIQKYSGADAGWKAAMHMLEAVLANPEWQNSDATLILSNHFIRFLMLPWSEVDLDEAEKRSLLQERFLEVYGESSEIWDLRLNEGVFGFPSLACAMQASMLEQIKSAFSASSIRLKSIQPFLMTAFNLCRKSLGKGTAWFILAEQGIFCIGLLHKGRWQRIKLRLSENEGFDEAIRVLEREMLLADRGAENSQVFLYSPENPVYSPISRNGLVIHPLLPAQLPSSSHKESSAYAMAAAGI